jgi:hypothetical protein
MSHCHCHDTDHHPWDSATRKIENSDFRLLAQFGLTPKSRHGLPASEAVDVLDAL